MSNDPASTPAPRRRDPEQRKRAIVEAAAALIVQDGVVDLTHRRVAAKAGVSLSSTTYHFASLEELTRGGLDVLAAEVDAGLEEVAAALREHGPKADLLAATLHDYLADTARVRADAALYFAGTHSPDLRPLGSRWFDRFVVLLSEYFSEPTARALAIWTDGATVHAALHDEPLGIEELERGISALIVAGAGGTQA